MRTRAEGDAVALSPDFRETLDRHAVLLKQAAPFRARPRTFDRLLGERAGIGQQDLDAFEVLHARAGTYRRSTALKAAQAQRMEERLDHERTVEPVEAATPDWRALYDALQQDWNELIDRATQPDLPLLLVEGYDDLILRVRALAKDQEVAETERKVLTELIEYHDSEAAARETVRDYLAAAECHVQACEPLRRVAGNPGIHLSEVVGYTEMGAGKPVILAETGKAILDDENSYGPWLDSIAAGKQRARLTVDQLRNRIEVRPRPGAEGGGAASPGPSRPRSRRKASPIFSTIPKSLRNCASSAKSASARRTRGSGRAGTGACACSPRPGAGRGGVGALPGGARSDTIPESRRSG